MIDHINKTAGKADDYLHDILPNRYISKYLFLHQKQFFVPLVNEGYKMIKRVREEWGHR